LAVLVIGVVNSASTGSRATGALLVREVATGGDITPYIALGVMVPLSALLVDRLVDLTIWRSLPRCEWGCIACWTRWRRPT
jgi:hypothetical protein